MYSTGCSKCQVLQRKLNEKRIEYEKVSDINLMREKGIQSVPVLQVGGTRLNFAEAVKYVNSL